MNSATRVAYSEALVELAGTNPDVVVLDADLAAATKSGAFKEVAPERYFDMGIAEADMIGTAAGLASCGKIPFATSFAVFSTGRAFEQIRNAVAYPNLNVKVVGTHAGPSCGEDGASHQSVADIAVMRALPNMTVLVASDDVEAHAMTLAAADYVGPQYLRFSRLAAPTFHSDDYQFKLGKGELLREGDDVTIIACGLMVVRALDACDVLASLGIGARVINMPTIKPIDEELIVESAQKTGKIITVEEGNIIGGLGSAVAEVLSEQCPTPLRRIGMPDCFGKSGDGNALLEEYGLSSKHIVEVATSMVSR